MRWINCSNIPRTQSPSVWKMGSGRLPASTKALALQHGRGSTPWTRALEAHFRREPLPDRRRIAVRPSRGRGSVTRLRTSTVSDVRPGVLILDGRSRSRIPRKAHLSPVAEKYKKKSPTFQPKEVPDAQIPNQHVAGKTNTGPDAASRYPSTKETSSFAAETSTLAEILPVLRVEPTDQDIRYSSEIHESMSASAQVAPITVDHDKLRAVTWDLIKDECLIDRTIIDLVTSIDSGLPDSRTALPDHPKMFWPMATCDSLPRMRSIT